MLASFTTDANFSSTISNSNDWWIGEKYDGIRCCWNSEYENVYPVKKKKTKNKKQKTKNLQI
jgi:hypothetical protein